MMLESIGNTLLDEASAPRQLRAALDNFTHLCGRITGIVPDPSFDGWAEDALLESGVAINAVSPHTIRLIIGRCLGEIDPRNIIIMELYGYGGDTSRLLKPHTGLFTSSKIKSQSAVHCTSKVFLND